MENDELAQHLESLRREDCYRVDAVLKQSAHETTQRVFFVGENGAETGPYIRKFIRQDPGMGVAYERIFAAQQSGRRFKYLPDILECYARNGFLVVVMEHVRGETLQEVVYRLDPSMALAADIFPRLCDAVSELHDEFDPPIIHRDLKPSNIILSQAGLAIIDFGIAREFKDESDSDTTHFGTRGFAPPEQFGFGQTTVRSDIYSLGMVLYYMLAEKIPDASVRDSQFADPRIPEPVRQVICKAAAFDPDARYASVRDLNAAFKRAISVPAGDEYAQGPQASNWQQPAASAGGGTTRASAQAGPAFASSPAQGPTPSSAPATPTAMPSAPAPTPASAPAPNNGDMPFRVLGEIWNFLLAILVIAAFFHCGTEAAHPRGAMVGNPPLYNYLHAFLFVWPSFILLGLLLSDKRRLKQRFPRLAKWRWWQWVVLCVGGMVALAFLTILLIQPIGAVAVAP